MAMALTQKADKNDSALLLAAFNSNLLGLALPIVIMQVYDRVIPNQSFYTLNVLIGGLVVAMLLDALIHAAQARIKFNTGLRNEYFQQLQAIDIFLGARPESIAKTSIGGHLDRMKSIEQINDFDASHVHATSIDILFLVINLFLIWLISGILILVPLVVCVLFCLGSLLLADKVKSVVEQRSRLESIRQDFLMEVLGGLHVIRAMAMEASPIRQYESLQASVSDNTQQNSQILGLIQSMGIFASQLIIVGFISLGAIAVLNGNLGVGALAACTMLAGRILQPFLRGIALWAIYLRVSKAKHSANDLMTMDQEPRASAQSQSFQSPRLQLNNVSYQYPGTDKPLFRGLNINAPAGSMIGITGPNSCGKSTLLELIAGNMRPTSGEILIGGKPAESVERDQIAILPQRGSLFHGTLLENMVMYRGQEHAAEAMRIADALGLRDLLLTMPFGLDTPVNTGDATSLSSGVKQQILIVRNLCNRAPLILVDEANSLLDRPSDERFVELLQSYRGSHTIIINTHRPSLLRMCDRAYNIRDGRLIPFVMQQKPLPTAA